MSYFKKWITLREGNDWLDYHRNRGSLPHGHVGASASAMTPYGHDVKSRKIPNNIEDIQDLMAHYDRILDSAKVDREDISIFIFNALHSLLSHEVVNLSTGQHRELFRRINWNISNLGSKIKFENRLDVGAVRVILRTWEKTVSVCKEFVMAVGDDPKYGSVVDFVKKLVVMIGNLIRRLGEDSQDWKRIVGSERLKRRSLVSLNKRMPAGTEVFDAEDD